MCGIFCACGVQTETRNLLSIYEDVKPILKRRGPDYEGYEIVISDNNTLVCAATVLWTQGKALTQQPIVDDRSVFMYNGDIFGGMNVQDGDTKTLHIMLKESVNTKSLSEIEGPYAFIYFDKIKKKLQFCRDPFGRRSLLIGYSNNTLVLTSIAKKTLNCIELPAIGIFTYDLETEQLILMPWNNRHSNFFDNISAIERALSKTVTLLENVTLELSKFSEPTQDDLVVFHTLSEYKNTEILQQALHNHNWLQKVTQLKQVLEEAVKVRVQVTSRCRDCFGKGIDCQHCTIGVLFSGGIDCTVLALLLNEYVHKSQPIDLLNVIFDPKASDRQTGLQSLEELKQLCPSRNWNFLEMNIGKEVLVEERLKTIADLIHPLNTILDDSLGCALWFASRGQTKSYTSSCRILISGMGADELFGGYTKHRRNYKRSGWKGLYRSLEDDWQNISFRNLARDDRVIADHGRQLRTPYLDEKVVNFVRSLRCSERTCPTDQFPQGIGEKLLLRCLAYYLGLKNAAVYKKKALQFGSRIANSKENAHEPSIRLCIEKN